MEFLENKYLLIALTFGVFALFKLRRGLRHAHAHLGALLLQQAQQFTALVDRDTARDTQKDFLSGKIHIVQDRKTRAVSPFPMARPARTNSLFAEKADQRGRLSQFGLHNFV
mgnify:CR=1 FL=1